LWLANAVNLGGYLLTIRSLFPSRPQQTKPGRIELNDASIQTPQIAIRLYGSISKSLLASFSSDAN
jgi:hypothetical protein